MKRTIIAGVALLLLAACSSKPSDSEVKAALLDRYSPDNPLFAVENIQKVNGREVDANTYAAEVKYDLVTKVSFAEAADLIRKEAQESNNPVAAMSATVMLGGMRITMGEFAKGQRIPKQEELVLVKTEKGWKDRPPQ